MSDPIGDGEMIDPERSDAGLNGFWINCTFESTIP